MNDPARGGGSADVSDPPARKRAGEGIADLMWRLVDEARDLIRAEVAFARAEIEERIAITSKSALPAALAVVLLVVAVQMFALGAALAIGEALGGRWALGLVIVGAAAAAGGGFTLRAVAARYKRASGAHARIEAEADSDLAMPPPPAARGEIEAGKETT